MMGVEDGLLSRWQLRLLRALFKDAWIPEKVGDGDVLYELTAGAPRPVRLIGPKAYQAGSGGAMFVRMMLVVRVAFDWDLEADEE